MEWGLDSWDWKLEFRKTEAQTFLIKVCVEGFAVESWLVSI